MEFDDFLSTLLAMHENLETLSTAEIVKIWCDEYERTTGNNAMVVKSEGEWIHIKTPSHAGQPWQRCHLIMAIQKLQTRPDFTASIYEGPEFATTDVTESPPEFVESRASAA